MLSTEANPFRHPSLVCNELRHFLFVQHLLDGRLGAFGVESATPIVVPPAMGTLFVGSAHERLINDGGVIHPAEVVTLSLTFDHKVVNGATAAAFLQEVRKQMEGFKLPG